MTAFTTAFELMKAHWRWWLTIGAMVIFSWLWNENTRINSSLNTLQAENNSNRAVMDNVLKTVAITNMILGANQHAKNQIALESQGAQADIKVAVANDDCAHRPVPAAAADRLREYADSVRAGSGGATSGKPDN
ncbi:hypothetical protein SK37_01970 [Citrobacter sp. MGH109]|nr:MULTISPECIES: DUF2570 domain-containing protein [Citrobacter freundii complex]EKV4359818.1 DUF2570 domain-containing protein [Citrobacter freundii]ELE2062758.1 DUF2570 domain-containing protein [Citrobacter freundii]ELK6675800.1 DUF2570 domain-containing protein [Citrobacter freundii]KLV84216.1 hypothetical protein SK37_01970 [Citrobacter sp. MGH109]MBN4827922.1 DUF2570 domain-containing protein [Citrobacter freundii]